MTDADPREQAAQAAGRIADLTGVPRHDAVVVLGTGWAPAADAFGEPVAELPMTDVPGFVAPAADGHRGTIASYDVEGVPTLVLSGRTHLYEGLGLRPVVHGIRTAAACGCTLALLTNANGSLRDDLDIGQPVLLRDHLNLTGTSPIEGAHFVDLTDCWSARLRGIARELYPSLVEATYAWLAGPHYETLAEAEWVRRVGGDVLGMSTVPEAIAGRECGLEVLGLSTVTAIEGQDSGIDPREVVAVAERTAARMGPLLADLVRKGLP
ncbi:MAG TPA: purine-nucleoside phosphorylase [Nocardioides sp.]|uniref:purine-nucleoside phosphorylase n=1 Tax=Nocardioides sp. TaxID=35761 RepID=UPI002F3EF20E